MRLHLRLFVVEALANSAEEATQALETLGVGCAEQLHDALVMHDLLSQHAQLEQLSDEADVAE